MTLVTSRRRQAVTFVETLFTVSLFALVLGVIFLGLGSSSKENKLTHRHEALREVIEVQAWIQTDLGRIAQGMADRSIRIAPDGRGLRLIAALPAAGSPEPTMGQVEYRFELNGEEGHLWRSAGGNEQELGDGVLKDIRFETQGDGYQPLLRTDLHWADGDKDRVTVFLTRLRMPTYPWDGTLTSVMPVPRIEEYEGAPRPPEPSTGGEGSATSSDPGNPSEMLPAGP